MADLTRKDLYPAFNVSLGKTLAAAAWVDGDLNEVGTWRLQAKISIGGGVYRSDVGTFKVYENL